MAFIAGTKVFTGGGWKNIEDISGRDKVLVRNFISEAELVQPFALRKRHYEGEVIQIGAKGWSFTVTPNHKVVYNVGEYKANPDYRFVPAEDLILSDDHRIQRQFKYVPTEIVKDETIRIRDELGDRSTTVKAEDWYALVGIFLARGNIVSAKYTKRLYFNLRKENIDKEVAKIGGILDKYGIRWEIKQGITTFLEVRTKTTLLNRFITRLKSTNRKRMYLPDTMIYQSDKKLVRILIENLIEMSMRPGTKRDTVYIFVTPNKKLVDTLCVFGTLGGYSMRPVLRYPAGTKFKDTMTKRDVYNLHISSGHDTYEPRYKKSKIYSGSVYEIDLFDGQIYVKEGSMPVWIDPK